MDDLTSPQPPSRYKSQRRNQAAVDEAADALPSTTENGITRSRSRYHRKPTPATASPPDTARPASQEQRTDVPSRYHSKHQSNPIKSMYQEQVIQAPTQHRRTSDNHRAQREAPATPPAESGAPSAPQRPPFHSTHSAELFPPTKPVTPPKIDGPPQSSAIRATKSVDTLSDYGEAGEGSGCFSGLFKRKKGDVTPPAAQNVPNARPTSAKEDRTIRPGGGGIVPGTDAPVSAINSGDRQVLLECGKSKTSFPITPETTCVDLIKSAATCMSQRIDVKSAILLEYFNTVGVERPLRRYERIRDVMNSWDHDLQNSLILIDPGTGNVETELTTAGVPQRQPGEQTWFLHYSQKPGKWEKRYVTLREGGQMVQSKEVDALSKDITNMCHLSDFDIYTPTKEKARKKFKPPKARCYAIKSQQKTSLFESTQDYVHLFSTGDPQTADSFHDAVQAWRSWYLANVKGEGQKENQKAKTSAGGYRVGSSEQAKTHHVKGSADSQYQIGSFKPMMDPDTFHRRHSSSDQDVNGFAKSSNQFDVNVSPERRTSTARRNHEPVALNKKTLLGEDEPLGNFAKHGSHQRSPESSDTKDFAMLGRGNSQRRKEKEIREKPTTTSTREVKRSSSTRDNGRNGSHVQGGSADLQRSGSRREKPKPLVDLTPQYREPIQHKKGKGYSPNVIGAGGLIESATSPENPLNIPQQTIFRNPSAKHRGHTGSRTASGSAQQSQPIRPQLSFSRPDDGFTSGGLLAQEENRQGQGAATKGKGVIDGSRAGGKPLINFNEGGTFVKGSLLNGVERSQGGPVPAPVIDRGKR